MTKICTICARGGSKGVPGKNIRDMAGKPLIAWTVEQAKAAGVFDMVAVSSDSAAILDAAMAAGADLAVTRPDEMATDAAGKVPAILHCLLAAETELGREAIVNVDLDATSPLRLVDDILGAMALQAETGAGSVITGMPARRSPYFNLVERDGEGNVSVSKMLPQEVLRRQDAPECFDMNGSVYVWDRARFVGAPSVWFPDTRLFEMPEERSIDIDGPLDWDVVEMLMRRRYI